jgi:hypothetical protein
MSPSAFSLAWIVPTVRPNGSLNSFEFSQSPVYLSWNGLNQFQGLGYTVTQSGGYWVVQLEDANGQVITPNAGDDLRALVLETSGGGSASGPGSSQWNTSPWNTFTWGAPGSPSAAGGVPLSTIIYNAFRLVNILKGPQYQVSPDDATEAILCLNSLVPQWSTERLMIYQITRTVVNVNAGQGVYTLGVGAPDWNIPWPPQITRASIILESNQPQPLELPMQMLTVEEWQQVPIKNTPSNFPLWAYWDRAYPVGNFNVWPVPQETNQIALYLWALLPNFATATDRVILPLGYQRAIEYNLALELATRYPAEAIVSQYVISQAAESKARIKANNATPLIAACDSAALSRHTRGGFDWRIGDWR